ncbi:single hybrid motif-containing protein [Leucogyrophana mollusca]|uniref:Single hybrid motif-containing protein n=1 Tax=Leucogyrophana mollusca TaxID=85980 RepID=A0ACB8BPI3_9AGAM|nr:single hybrid motif-containing protein [Leucogyrophana mollusca]
MRAVAQTLALGRSVSCTRTALQKRWLHRTGVRYAITNLEMPAMSPTMTEGGIAEWKKKEGEAFSAGDVLLEIETDKATIDVEAQDDGVLGKIIAPDGAKNVPVGRVIALLAEEGDDISNLEAPKEESKPSAPKPESSAASQAPPEPKPEPTPEAQAPSPPAQHGSHHYKHSQPLLPSVLRILREGNVANAEDIKGTGVRGMLTKGDVLAYLGKASSPTGTFKESKPETQAAPKPEAPKPLDGAAIRQLIVSGLYAKSRPAPFVSKAPATFDSIIADYLPPSPSSSITASKPPAPPAKFKNSAEAYFDGLF